MTQKNAYGKMGKTAGTCFKDAAFGIGLTAKLNEAASCDSTFYKPFTFFYYYFAFRLAPTLGCVNCSGY